MGLVFDLAEAINIGWGEVAGQGGESLRDRLWDHNFRKQVANQLASDLPSARRSPPLKVLRSAGFRKWFESAGRTDLSDHLTDRDLRSLGVTDEKTASDVGRAVGEAIAAIAFDRADWVQRELLRRTGENTDLGYSLLHYLEDIWSLLANDFAASGGELAGRHLVGPGDDNVAIDGGSGIRHSLQMWAERRLAHLLEPPPHMRSARMSLEHVRQEVRVVGGSDYGQEGDRARWAAPSWEELRGDVGAPRIRRAVLRGAAGYGKSTLLATGAADGYRLLLEHLSTATSDDSLVDAHIPIHVTCAQVDDALPRNSSGREQDLRKAILAVVAMQLGPAGQQPAQVVRWIERRLSHPQTTVYLDALDEVREPDPETLTRRANLLAALSEFAAHSKACLYLSTRPYDVPELALPDGVLVELAGFGPPEITAFTDAWLGEERGAQLRQRLQGRLSDVAQVPLILSFLCLVADKIVTEERQRPPMRLYDIYSFVVSRLLEGAWKDAPNAARRRERLRLKLTECAWSIVQGGWTVEFTSHDLEDAVGGPDDAHELRSAGIVTPSISRLAFLHPSVGEHLVASYLVALPAEERWDHVLDRVEDIGWSNVWPQLAGALASDAAEEPDQLLELLLVAGRFVDAGASLAESLDRASNRTKQDVVDGLVHQLPRESESVLLRLGDVAVPKLADMVHSSVRDPQDLRRAVRVLAESTHVRAREAVQWAAQSPVLSVAETAQRALGGTSRPVHACLTSDPPTSQDIASMLTARLDSSDRPTRTNLVARAYTAACKVSEPHANRVDQGHAHHSLSVARNVAQLGLDDVTIMAALLHEAVAGDMRVDDVEADFGSEVADIVFGVLKLSRIRFQTKGIQHATAGFRKMLVALAKDLRVLIITLACRLEQMRAAGAMPPSEQERVARETLDIYAPLADRLGMQQLCIQLEDLSFAALHPKRYADVDYMVSSRVPDRDEFVGLVAAHVAMRLQELGVDAEIRPNCRHNWAIYHKMIVKGREFDEIFDVVAIRIIVEAVEDCYAVLGAIHATWKPVPGRIKDYICMPKFNLYQSLHTTVVGPKGRPIAVQIRTFDMHARAEWGAAAQWASSTIEGQSEVAWYAHQKLNSPEKFLESLKVDVKEVFVYTPKFRVMPLPLGATPIDFAYAVHTEVGHACIGAKVNGRAVAIDSELGSGDIVEILTADDGPPGPSHEWLNMVVSRRARRAIKRWLSRNPQRETTTEVGL